MAADGSTPPSDGASVAGDEFEDDGDADLLPLSRLFPVTAWKKWPVTAAVGGAAAEGGRNLRRRRCMLVEEGGDGVSASGSRGSFSDGDLVWAKAFPYTWWPGWVRRSRGAVHLVSFFGGDRWRWLEESGIRGFEKNYLRISKMVGARLACEVDCALGELGRRTALGMACGCRGAMGIADEHLVAQICKEREMFEPVEMLGFVRGLAVCAWVGDGQTIHAVRVAAQLNAYRSHVLVGGRVAVNGWFQPEEALDTIHCLAVSAWVDDEAAAGMAGLVAQLHAYRHFVSICSDWFAQSPAEEGGSLTGCSTSEDSEGSNLEMPFISLSKTEEAVDPDSLYANDVEEQENDGMMQEMEPDGEFCTINRIDYSILSSDMEFEHLFDNEMEDVRNWSGEKGVASDTEKNLDVSTLNEDRHNWICNLIHGLVSSDSGQEVSLVRESLERNPDNEFNVANAVSREAELLSSSNFDKSSVSIDSIDGSTNMRNNTCRYASCLDGFHGKEFDQNVAPDFSAEMHNAADLSLADASTSSCVGFTTENSSQFFVDFSPKHQSSMVAGMFHGEEGGLQALHEMLYYLYCLASDPLHMRSDSLLSFCQLVLSYRASTFQNISSLPSMIWTEETLKAQELDVWGHHHLTSESVEKHQDDKVAGMCEHSNIAGVSLHTHVDGTELQSSAECHNNLHILHATRDSIAMHSSTDVITASKTADKKYNAGIKIQFNDEKRPGKLVVDKRYAAASCEEVKRVSRLTFPASCDGEVASQKRRFDQEVSSATTTKLHAANCLGSDVKASTMSMILLDKKRSSDRNPFYIKQSDMSDETEVLFQDNAGYDAAAVRSGSNFSAVANTSGSKVVACSSALPPTCKYEAGSCRKRRLEQPVHSYISRWQKNSLFTSATKLYASPLVRDSLSATNRTQCSPIIGRRTAPSNSLHMKFPKGFNLPSQEDLEKTFSAFGPLDRSRTRVFFYTGAGKVVFLNPVDAETAYNYVRRHRVFETDMRFWLYPDEELRKDCSTQTLPLSAVDMPALSHKSCLKTSSIHKNEDMKKKSRVWFSA